MDRNDRLVSREDDPSGVFGYGSTGQPEVGEAGLDQIVVTPVCPVCSVVNSGEARGRR